MDAKFENQDRMINFLLQQQTSLESQIKNQTQNYRGDVDIDRADINRLKSDFRTQHDVSQQTLNMVT